MLHPQKSRAAEHNHVPFVAIDPVLLVFAPFVVLVDFLPVGELEHLFVDRGVAAEDPSGQQPSTYFLNSAGC